VPKQELASHIPQFVEGVKFFACEKDIHYDVIHSHYWLSGVAAEALSAAWGGVPIVHMFHTLGEMKNRIARSEAEREGRYRIEGERQVLRHRGNDRGGHAAPLPVQGAGEQAGRHPPGCGREPLLPDPGR
jgi:hypothetical protein